MKHLELGTIVEDSATRLTGMLTHVQAGSDESYYYFFQPRGLNPEDGTPVKGIWITGERIMGGKLIDTDVPLDMLNTIVEDKASGYKGTVTYLTLHVSGCVHAVVQAKGRVKKNGNPIDPIDVDIRRLEGKMVPKLSEPEKKKSMKEKPSPVSLPSISLNRIM